MSFIYTSFIGLTWWQMVLWLAYAIYFIIRAYNVWDCVDGYGFKKGYRYFILGYKKEYRLYHLIRTILDIPSLVVGLFFPALKKIFGLKLYTFKDEKEQK